MPRSRSGSRPASRRGMRPQLRLAGVLAGIAAACAMVAAVASPSAATAQARSRAATVRLLERGIPFTAIFAFNDLAAIGAITVLREAGIDVPSQVSVVGFDDIQGAAYHNPSLTTIRQPLNNMGITAARILLQRLQGKKDYPEQVAIVPELIIRESTLPPNQRRPMRHS